VRSDKFHQNAAERIRRMNHQAIFVAPKIKDDPIVTDEIYGNAELSFDLRWVRPSGGGCNCEPGPDRTLSLRVAGPEFFERPTGDHLHCQRVSCHQIGDNSSQLSLGGVAAAITSGANLTRYRGL
jgi:hypothetical protein